MQVILTHEQADFDAIASLLGAFLLNPQAYPVIPNNLNRNVNSFIHLYNTELPFINQNELPNERIGDVILVDTQSLVTIKGISKKTKVHVIDHHEKKEDFPPEWNFRAVQSSSCTTYFVEQLQENNGNLNLIQATLLLLGIYEDTGSLSYTNTAARDVMAAAFLLEKGASLKIATEFLNPPLSKEQRQVFDSLTENMQTVEIEGCNILISSAEASKLEDAVSSIAHKISDFFDPDGLFIFVKTHEGIRLVARSTTDQINVGEIAKEFNGGGHAKAAAALIKSNPKNPNQLDDIVQILKRELDKYVLPAVTVRHIMSKKPLTITPDTTAEEAYELMQRFGYEGYPVVEKGQIKGLLNRRSVDRALSHEMNLSASSLMEAGPYFVYPENSLETLQKIMADSGWGQIPVLNRQDGNVIGIVTRTDLLKSLAGRSSGSTEQINLAGKIESLLPFSRIALLKSISSAADSLNIPIYLVGGLVRDLLLEKPSLDMDFVVEGDAIRLGKKLSEEFGGRITTHKKFGTAKWHIRNLKLDDLKMEIPENLQAENQFPDFIDLISARTEYYERPTALPTVKKSSIKLDLHRRDFTINTMAIRLDGSHYGDLYDYWGGLNDLKNEKIRVLHSLSFVDDPTRMLRAVRFEQRFGFNIEKRTLQLLSEATKLLEEVSGDRIRHEFDQILEEPNAIKMLNRLQELNLISPVHPAIIWNDEIREDMENFLKSDFQDEWRFPENMAFSLTKKWGAFITLFMKIENNSIGDVSKRLRFSSHLRQQIINANTLWHKRTILKELSPRETAKFLEKFSQLALFCVFNISKDEQIKNKVGKFAKNWRWIEPHTDGNKLKEMGIPPGPVYKKIISDLRFSWIEGRVRSEKEETEYLEKLVKKHVNIS